MPTYTARLRKQATFEVEVTFDAPGPQEAQEFAIRWGLTEDWASAQRVDDQPAKLVHLAEHRYPEAWFEFSAAVIDVDGGTTEDFWAVRLRPDGTTERHFAVPEGVKPIGSVHLSTLRGPEADRAVREWLTKHGLSLTHITALTGDD